MKTLVAFAVLAIAAQAQEHVVPLQELQGKLQSAAQERAKDIADVQRVLSLPAAAEALGKANVNPEQMRAAVATLSSAELARLARQARAAEHEVQAGFIRGILTLIGLVVVIVIIVVLVT